MVLFLSDTMILFLPWKNSARQDTSCHQLHHRIRSWKHPRQIHTQIITVLDVTSARSPLKSTAQRNTPTLHDTTPWSKISQQHQQHSRPSAPPHREDVATQRPNMAVLRQEKIQTPKLVGHLFANVHSVCRREVQQSSPHIHRKYCKHKHLDHHFDINTKTLYTPGTTQARDKHNIHNSYEDTHSQNTAKSKRCLPRVPSFGKIIRFVHDRVASQITLKNPQTQPCQKYLRERPLHTTTMVPFLVSVVVAPLATPREKPTTTRHVLIIVFALREAVCAPDRLDKRDERRNTSTIRSAAMQQKTNENIQIKLISTIRSHTHHTTPGATNACVPRLAVSHLHRN